MKTKKRIFLLAFSTLFFANVHTLNAQVTIGGETAPVKGATLDLSPSGGYVGGFKLPSVSLDDLISIPDAFDDKSLGTIVATDLAGTMVYNTNSTIGTGVYLWDGAKWQAMFSAGTGSLLNSIYPVGSIYMSIDPTDPTDIFGGTWEAWGEGRVPVGVATSGTFNSVEKTGGAETHTLTVAQIPAHEHGQRYYSKYHNGIRQMGGDNSTAGSGNNKILDDSNSQPGAKSVITTQSIGGSQAHNNLQPYITCYMWKRIS